MDDCNDLDACCPADDRTPPTGVERRRRACRIFKALGDGTRIELFALIASRPEPICVCDIVARFDLSQPTISHHLKVLRQAGLVHSTRRGTWSYYEVSPAGVAAARDLIDGLLPRPVSAPV